MAKKSSTKKASKKKASAKKAAQSTAKKTAAQRSPRRPAGPTPEQKHEKAYTAAVEMFNRGRFAQALKRFNDVAEGPDPGLRHRAQVYANICRQRTESAKLSLKTPEDQYNYAVRLINDRELEEAEKLLVKALKGSKRAGHVQYALALIAAFPKLVTWLPQQIYGS